MLKTAGSSTQALPGYISQEVLLETYSTREPLVQALIKASMSVATSAAMLKIAVSSTQVAQVSTSLVHRSWATLSTQGRLQAIEAFILVINVFYFNLSIIALNASG